MTHKTPNCLNMGTSWDRHKAVYACIEAKHREDLEEIGDYYTVCVNVFVCPYPIVWTCDSISFHRSATIDLEKQYV